MTLFDRETLGAGFGCFTTVVAAIFVVLSAIAFVLTALATLMAIMGFRSGFDGLSARDLWWAIWFPAAALISTYNTVESLRFIGNQETRQLAIVVGLSLVALISFPGFYISIYGA